MKKYIISCSLLSIGFLLGACSDTVKDIEDTDKHIEESNKETDKVELSVENYDFENMSEKELKEYEDKKGKFQEENSFALDGSKSDNFNYLEEIKLSLNEIKNNVTDLNRKSSKVFFHVESSLNSDVILQVESLLINGASIDNKNYLLSSELKANGKGDFTLALYSSDNYNLPEKIDNLNLILRIVDKNSLSILGYKSLIN